ncbi:MAG: 2-nitropropane dioxygenase, partial [Desulfatirhabdiaceae bacterium]
MDDEQTIRSAIQNVNDSVILIDLNGRLGMSQAGSTNFSGGINQVFDGYTIVAIVPALPLENLGDPWFKQMMGLKYPYVIGAMAHGITSVEMVCVAAKAGMMGFFGAAGLLSADVETAINRIQAEIGDLPFGFNLIHSPYDPELESRIVTLYLRHSIRRVCASAFLNLTPALVRYRVSGIYQNQQGDIVCPNQVVAKVSREEVARKFFSPPPDKLLNQLV